MTKKELNVQKALGTLPSKEISKLFMKELKATVKPISVPYISKKPLPYVRELERVAKQTKEMHKNFKEKYSFLLYLGEENEDGCCHFDVNTRFGEDWTMITLAPRQEDEEEIWLTEKVVKYLSIDRNLTVGIFGNFREKLPSWKENTDS